MSEHVRVMVVLDITLRDYARLEARRAGMTLSKFIARAAQQAVAKASADRAIRDAITRDSIEVAP